MRNLKLDLCYDGTRYRGWQRLQNTDNTIQGKLEKTLSRLLEEPIQLNGSGRTDAGVHALHQIASFHCENPMPCSQLQEKLREYLPEDIGVYCCEEVEPRFHARLHAVTKTYCYRIWNSAKPQVFERRYVAVFPEALSLEAMQAAAQKLLGKHDFAAFCARAAAKKSTIRTLYRIDIVRLGEEIRISVTGDGFLYNMMRILVGTLIEAGRGERSVESVALLFQQKRENAGFLAPACGLCLMEVTY